MSQNIAETVSSAIHGLIDALHHPEPSIFDKAEKYEKVEERDEEELKVPVETTKFNFCIDRGGTFTDVYADIPKKYHKSYGKSFGVMKLLSVESTYHDAPTEGIRRILEEVTGNTEKYGLQKNKVVKSDEIGFIRMGTTVATNALLERKGERCALLITKGFRY
ncbi:hypothetical protein RFI_15199, partial [Reticulomyxa filosa]